METEPKPFNLLRWFGALSFITIAAAATATAAMLSYFLAGEILRRHASQTASFVSTVSQTQSKFGGFRYPDGMAELLGSVRAAEELGVGAETAQRSKEEFFDHMRALPSMVSVDIYGRNRERVWSYAKHEVANEARSDNAELLDQIFSYRRAGADDVLVNWDYHSAEFVSDRPGRYDISYYVPLYDSQGQVAAVVRICEAPLGLLGSVRRGQILAWSSLLVAGALIYAILFWIVRRAAVLIASQQHRLVESETLAAVGELSLAVAHGIRNPLAAIRSGAELMLDDVADGLKANVRNIIEQVDRLSHWLRDLLVFSEPPTMKGKVDIVPVIEEALENFRLRFAQHCITAQWIRPTVDAPPVVGNRSLFLQVFNSIIANAVEAMPGGGTLAIRCDVDEGRGRVVVHITDTGMGMSTDVLARAFKPFNTTKPRGLGVGLTLVKRILDRCGGSVCIESSEQAGTAVDMTFPVSG